jgi:Tol biopolymer transport system component
VPSSIKVGHNCSVINKQVVCTTWDPPISLETYVSNGLLGEWIGWWAPDSLEAGAVAYRSYGAYFVANPLSPNYDICDNTYCQVYNLAIKPTKKSNAAVTATAGVVLSGDNVNIIKAEYAAESNMADDVDPITHQPLATCGDGNVGEPTQNWPCMKDFVCAGKTQAHTHSRGMCQRGSQRWASGLDYTGAPGDTGLPILNSQGVAISPRNWQCILNHYYNANSNSITVDPSGTGNPGAGSGLRTSFMQGQPTYGQIAYELNSTPVGIRVANAADGSLDHLLVSTGFQPTWAPGGNQLAYNTGNGIAIINVDGITGAQQLTTNSSDYAPAWSPLGDKIAFCSTRAGEVDVWVMNADGSGAPQQVSQGVQLQELDYETEDCYLGWSPDGTKIAFTGQTANIPYGSRYNVYTMNSANGSSVTQLTNCFINGGGVSVCSTPSWSPDGTKIAFSDGDTPFGDALGGGGVYTMDPNGGNVAPVHQDENTWSFFPKWSADGKTIFYVSGPGTSNGVYSIKPDGTGLKEISNTSGRKTSSFNIDCSRCARFDQ